MSFLYPLFLIAGAALAIPVLIHLFNLRRYKTVYFPHTRFLKNIQLHSRRQSQLRYKWLLALRLLFLASLILAFAQPFFNNGNKKDAGKGLQVIYIDNSGSMSMKKGARSLLEMAKEAASRQVRQSAPGTRYILLTNDKPVSYKPLTTDRILAEINKIEVSALSRNADKTLALVNNMIQTEASGSAALYYYSDFQQVSFPANADKNLMQHISFYGIPVQSDNLQNLYIDTAYLASPVLQTGQSNKLIVHSKMSGNAGTDAPVIQLSVNGQVKSAASPRFNEKNESTDTISFSINDAGWQKLVLHINDASVRFDDSFRISARSTPGLSVLVLNENQANPYLQAAFRAEQGFRLTQMPVSSTPANWQQYNLVILNGITRIDAMLGKQIAEALDKGQSICLFPGMSNNISAINEGLKMAGDIQFTGIDTAVQTISSLQEGSELVKDMFEHIPENVQLPVATRHYIITGGLSANQQSILSFRNGDPFLARYTPSKGYIYICAGPADMQGGNFVSSYFFVPFLYQMAMQSHGSDIYAMTLGRHQPAYLPLQNTGERNMVHIYGQGMDMIPAQRPNSGGVDVFADQSVSQPGFYTLSAAGTDTAMIALNEDRTESKPDVWEPAMLEKQWQGSNIHWLKAEDAGHVNGVYTGGSFPLWKVCVILALIMLAAETYVVAGGLRKTTAATQ